MSRRLSEWERPALGDTRRIMLLSNLAGPAIFRAIPPRGSTASLQSNFSSHLARPIQAFTPGKIVDEIVEHPMAPEAWTQITRRLIRPVFGGQPHESEATTPRSSSSSRRSIDTAVQRVPERRPEGRVLLFDSFSGFWRAGAVKEENWSGSLRRQRS